MAKDLRSFLSFIDEVDPTQLLRVKQHVDPANYDCTAIMEQLARRGRHPMVRFESTQDVTGQPVETPVLMNAFATR